MTYPNIPSSLILASLLSGTVHLLVHDQPMPNQTDYLQELYGSHCSDRADLVAQIGRQCCHYSACACSSSALAKALRSAPFAKSLAPRL